MSEAWVDEEIFCPSCGNDISRFKHNNPVADFFCPKCLEEYELKSKSGRIGIKLVNGAYNKVIERLGSNNNPNLFILNYEIKSLQVCNFFIVPKHFFVPEIIEKRKPLSLNARRAGWVGCNIILANIPEAGRIFYIKNKQLVSKEAILESWANTSFLRLENNINDKRWIIDILKCIDNLNKKEFSLREIYQFETDLKIKHKDNNHIKAKIRQQLQILRDNGMITFLGRGKYKVK